MSQNSQQTIHWSLRLALAHHQRRRRYGLSDAAAEAIVNDVFRMYQLKRRRNGDPLNRLLDIACTEVEAHVKLRGLNDPEDAVPAPRNLLFLR